MGGVGVAYPLMVFTAILNQVYMLLDFNRQNCVYSSSCLILMSSISAVAVCCVFSSSLTATMHTPAAYAAPDSLTFALCCRQCSLATSP